MSDLKALSNADLLAGIVAQARKDALQEAVDVCDERADQLDTMGIETECCVGTAKNCASDITALMEADT